MSRGVQIGALFELGPTKDDNDFHQLPAMMVE